MQIGFLQIFKSDFIVSTVELIVIKKYLSTQKLNFHNAGKTNTEN